MFFFHSLLRPKELEQQFLSSLPDNMEYSRDGELVVDGYGHVARLVEGGGNSPNSIAEIDTPQQEDQLSCSGENRQRIG